MLPMWVVRLSSSGSRAAGGVLVAAAADAASADLVARGYVSALTAEDGVVWEVGTPALMQKAQYAGVPAVLTCYKYVK